MMKTKNFFILTMLLLIVLTGCEPRIITSFVKTYSIPVSKESVRVFEQGDTINGSFETLGTVAVVDAGPTTKCKYDYVLDLAKKEVAKAGGNGFQIVDHALPSISSSCHQISGLALYIAQGSANYADSNQVSYALENPQYSEKSRRRTNAPKLSIGAYFGGGWISSKVYTDRGIHDWIGGADWRIELEYVSKNGVGLDLQYSGWRSTIYAGYTMEQIYIGPTLIYKGGVNNWLFKVGLGIGYFGLKEQDKSSNLKTLRPGVGFNSDIAVEYMLSKNLGISGGVSAISGYFEDKGESMLEDVKVAGIKRLNFMAGLHYYF